jgi:tetratricopeptide (TPR) repeat protein
MEDAIMLGEEKTVFISYRRETSKYIARAVFMDLRANGYDAFMDIESIDSGTFDTIILNQIAARAHFVVILTHDSLQKCADPNDWLRREIEHAIRLQRNIVPIMVEDFSFSQVEAHLVGELKELPRYNALKLISEYFDEGMARLRSRYLKQPVYGAIVPTPPQDWSAMLETITIASSEAKPTETDLKAEALIRGGSKHFIDEQYEQAVKLYTEAIELAPGRAIAYNMRGSAYRALGNIDRAMADYNRAIEINPDYWVAYKNRGALHLQYENYPAALDDFRQLVTLDNESIEGRYGMFAACYHLGDYDQALTWATELVDAIPSEAWTFGNRAECLFATGRYEEALADYEQARSLDPDYPLGIAGLAITLHALKRDAEAERLWTQLINIDDRYLDPEWFGAELKWADPLIDQARALVNLIQGAK